MDWWAWITVGAILLGAELAFIDAQFYLVILGASALAVGFVSVAGLVWPDWLQWLAFSALALLTMVFFRRRIYERIRHRLPGMQGGPAGDVVTLPEPLDPGATCRIEYRGSSWSVVNQGPSAIPSGGRARIDRIDGLTLVVRADA